jgi:hypothetical protein
VQLSILGLFLTIPSASLWKWLTVLPHSTHHHHHRITPFVDWANGITDAQWHETVHAYQT